MSPSAHQQALAAVIRGLSALRDAGCLVDAGGTLLFVNDAWQRGAAAGGDAAVIGTSWLDGLRGEEVRRAHAELLSRALAPPHPRGLTLVAEANTATRAALVSTRLDPVLHAGEPLGVRVLRSVVRERPVEEVYDVVDRPPDAYRGPDGAVAQCPCCRRVRDPAAPDRWDLVPALLDLPVAAHDELCELCRSLHYPGC
ncbi:MAG TPA: hypothetical protein VFP65_10620 [Anaeromyxobacteraceae bacterium]|nr:hypothetical protein [Anaeromyxobacteraceae bacterium]